MQMAQQNQPFGKRFNKEPTSSIFHFQPTQIVREDVQQEAVHENLEYLASIASISTPIPQTESSWISTVDSETIRSLNEICDRGFDELNTLIQEQRLVRRKSENTLFIERLKLRFCFLFSDSKSFER